MADEFKSYASFCRLMADENRLRIMYSMKGGEVSVSRVIEATKLSQPLVSYHLRTLRDQGLVTSERRGPFVLYRLVDENVLSWVAESKRFCKM